MVPRAAPCRALASSCPFPGAQHSEHEADQERAWLSTSETPGSPAHGEGRGLKEGVHMWSLAHGEGRGLKKGVHMWTEKGKCGGST